MKRMYVAGVEEKAGKTVVILGLAQVLRSRGFCVAYRKPVGLARTYRYGRPADPDGEAWAQALGVKEGEELIGVLSGEAPRAWRPPFDAWERIKAVSEVAADFLFLEGREWLGRGLLSGLCDPALARKFSAPILLVAKYRGEPTVDAILAAARIIGNEARLLGVILNEVSPEAELSEVQAFAAPFLEEKGIPVLGILPFERRLQAVRIHEVLEAMGAEVVVEGDLRTEVDRILVGAMGAETALQHLRRIPGQLVVITAGDRTDIQAAAISFPRVRAVILSGGIRPERAIAALAAEQRKTLAVAPQDTFTVAETADRLLGQTLSTDPERLAFLARITAENVDLDRMLELLG
ncbi:MAG: AAA family ATPase [Candidatus Bipolaricaulota bacterium]|nr:AAA family ATPase [Candidatus Bipolaricaulota bacterium]MDW8126314.1 AAA family ATPase [Candidatus Bipolaricaulota bacterium]